MLTFLMVVAAAAVAIAAVPSARQKVFLPSCHWPFERLQPLVVFFLRTLIPWIMLLELVPAQLQLHKHVATCIPLQQD